LHFARLLIFGWRLAAERRTSGSFPRRPGKRLEFFCSRKAFRSTEAGFLERIRKTRETTNYRAVPIAAPGKTL
jgi:hypothetical protein